MTSNFLCCLPSEIVVWSLMSSLSSMFDISRALTLKSNSLGAWFWYFCHLWGHCGCCSETSRCFHRPRCQVPGVAPGVGSPEGFISTAASFSARDCPCFWDEGSPEETYPGRPSPFSFWTKPILCPNWPPSAGQELPPQQVEFNFSCYVECHLFYRTQVYLGSDLWVQVSVSNWLWLT